MESKLFFTKRWQINIPVINEVEIINGGHYKKMFVRINGEYEFYNDDCITALNQCFAQGFYTEIQHQIVVVEYHTALAKCVILYDEYVKKETSRQDKFEKETREKEAREKEMGSMWDRFIAYFKIR